LSRLAALSVAALALLAAGCGDASKGKLNADQSKRLSEQLELAQAAVDKGACNRASEAAKKGANIASSFTRGVDAELQDNLVAGFNHLSERVDGECDRPEKETPTPTETPEETVTEAPTTLPTPSPTPSPTPTEDPTEEPTEAPTAAPTTFGGAEATP
jgi:outer membrane biosynthesis protein TonB